MQRSWMISSHHSLISKTASEGGGKVMFLTGVSVDRGGRWRGYSRPGQGTPPSPAPWPGQGYPFSPPPDQDRGTPFPFPPPGQDRDTLVSFLWPDQEYPLPFPSSSSPSPWPRQGIPPPPPTRQDQDFYFLVILLFFQTQCINSTYSTEFFCIFSGIGSQI